MDVLNQAISRFIPTKGLLLHSDRGSQYCNNYYQKIIKKNGFVCNMNRKSLSAFNEVTFINNLTRTSIIKVILKI